MFTPDDRIQDEKAYPDQTRQLQQRYSRSRDDQQSLLRIRTRLMERRSAMFPNEVTVEDLSARKTSDNQADLAEWETQVEIPALFPPRPFQRNHARQARRASVWMRTLAAVLLVGVLVGSFMALLALRGRTNQVANPHQGTSTTQTSACYALRQFDSQNNVTSDTALNYLAAVAAVSENDAWAVGQAYVTHFPNATTSTTFIEHWNGVRWQIVPSPNSTDGNGKLNAVAAVSTDDVWAVGSSEHGEATPGTVLPINRERTLIEHWDGRIWQIVPGPSGPTENGHLNAITAISQNDIWIAGSFYDTSQRTHALLDHWDGTSWHIVQTSNTSVFSQFNSISAVSANDIWAVGSTRKSVAQTVHALAEHWNGNAWLSMPVPQNLFGLYGVNALAANDVWATGGDANQHAFLEHWDGHQWSNVNPPLALTATQSLTGFGFTALSPRDVWVLAGITENFKNESGGDVSVQFSLILHWNGTSWQQVPLPADVASGSGQNSFVTALTVSGRQIWMVGMLADRLGSEALILGQRSCS